MKSGDDLIKTFARCFRLLTKLNAGIKDGFFVALISKESENLLSGYLKFLKLRGDIVAQSSTRVGPWKSKVGPWIQCRNILKTKIDTILKLLEIIKHTNQIDEIATPLLLERELLKLKLLFLNDSEEFPAAWLVELRESSNQKNQRENKNLKTPMDNLSELNSDKTTDRTTLQKLGEIHRQIAEFINGKERVQNVEVFGRFTDTSRRTLKRKLSELVKAGAIKRLPLGKKVFYVPCF